MKSDTTYLSWFHHLERDNEWARINSPGLTVEHRVSRPHPPRFLLCSALTRWRPILIAHVATSIRVIEIKRWELGGRGRRAREHLGEQKSRGSFLSCSSILYPLSSKSCFSDGEWHSLSANGYAICLRRPHMITQWGLREQLHARFSSLPAEVSNLLLLAAFRWRRSPLLHHLNHHHHRRRPSLRRAEPDR